jgi:hypothetical protein
MHHRQLLRKSLLLRRPSSTTYSPRCPPGIYSQSTPLLLHIAKANNATHHHHDIIFNCSQCAPFSTGSSISTSTHGSGKGGIVSRIKRVIRTIFGSNDDTPRGIQERKDMYWILLAMSHRNLRMEAQQQLKEQHNQNQQMMITTKSWNKETKEQIKQYMDDAITYLDTQTDINDMSLRQLRMEVQKRLQPQIVHLLNVACDVENEMMLRHDTDDDTDDNYEFSEVEATEYKEILLQEYDHVNKQIQLLAANGDDDDATIKSPEYYHLKKGAIETLLRYFDWMPLPNTTADSSQATHSNNIEHEEENYIDEFGFYPNRSEEDIVSAMRYYHVRNIVRSHRVRTSLDINNNNKKEENGRNGGFGGICTYSILPFKSTIPNAGRGVFIDGFAPAGTLLSFFPGKVWPKEHLMTASLQTQLQFSENDPRNQLSMRYDDILIDSRKSPYTVVKNLWAIAHIVNHPPPPPIKPTTAMGTVTADQDHLDNDEKKGNESNTTTYHFQPHQGPNTVTVPINFTADLSDDLRDYIPNEYELPPKSWAKDVFEKEKIIMHGMGLIALRDLKDEELFYDYRMSPNAKGSEALYPLWYHVWDVDAAMNRWSNEE